MIINETYFNETWVATRKKTDFINDESMQVHWPDLSLEEKKLRLGEVWDMCKSELMKPEAGTFENIKVDGMKVSGDFIPANESQTDETE